MFLVDDEDPFELVGDLIDGQFRVDAFVGFGDLSVVYRGFHVGVEANVALKFLDLPSTLDDALVAPLVRSFREGTKLHYRLARGHMHIAQSIGSGQTVAPRTGTVVPYLVREWLEGASLGHDFFERRARGLTGRSLVEAVDLFRGALEGLAYAHRQGVSHLALNPTNLFLAQSGPEIRLKILDFGVAHAMNEHAGPIRARKSSPQQPTGLRVLVPAYAAPEQLDAAIGQSGSWTDVYAMALLFVEALTDAPMFGDAPPNLDQALRPTARQVVLPANLDPRVAAVLERALRFSPKERQASAGVFWKDLSESLPTRTAAIVRRPSTAPKMPAMRRSPTLVGLNSTPAPFRAPTTRPPPPLDAASEPEALVPQLVPRKSQKPANPAPPRISKQPGAPPISRAPAPPMPPAAVRAPSTRPPPPPSNRPPPPPLQPGPPPPPAFARPITEPLRIDIDDAPTRQETAPHPLRMATPIAEPMYVETIARARAAALAPPPPVFEPPPPYVAPPPPPPRVEPPPAYFAPPFIPQPPLMPSGMNAYEGPLSARNAETVAPPRFTAGRKKAAIVVIAGLVALALVLAVARVVSSSAPNRTTANAIPTASAAPLASEKGTTTSLVAALPPPTSAAPALPTATASIVPPVATASTPPSVPLTNTASAASPKTRKHPFTLNVGRAALDQVAQTLADCKRPHGRFGTGSVRVTFSPDAGNVIHVQLGPPYSGSEQGKCITQKFRTAHVEPFRGPPSAMNYTFLFPR